MTRRFYLCLYRTAIVISRRWYLYSSLLLKCVILTRFLAKTAVILPPRCNEFLFREGLVIKGGDYDRTRTAGVGSALAQLTDSPVVE